MDILLIPGLWLDGSSWDEVTPSLERASHLVRPLALPGLQSVDADRSGIGRKDQLPVVDGEIPLPDWSEFDDADVRDLDDRLREWIAQENPYVAELAAMHDVEYVDLPTGHWPQFTKPTELGQAIRTAVDRT